MARLARAAFVFALVAAPIAVATAAFADDPGVQSTASVGNGAELREQWAIGNNTLITLTADIDLGVDGNGQDICNSGEPLRSNSNSSNAITIDGQGLFGITQTCDFQRVLLDEGDEHVTLRGLTHFEGGVACGAGGGLYTNGAADIENSTVDDNEASSDQACNEAVNSNPVGGGVYSDSGPVTVTDSTVQGNTAEEGGGVATFGAVTVTSSTFADNHATDGSGGGIRVFSDDATTTISGSTFDENTADQWGGAFEQQALNKVDAAATGAFTLQVDGSTFTGNTADGDGGGALDTEDPANVTVDGSTFTGNRGGWGGAIGTFGDDTALAVSTSTMNANHSERSGGAVQMANAGLEAAAAGTASATFVNSTVTGNSQQFGGALNVDGSLELRYVDVTDNTNEGEPESQAAGSRGADAQFVGNDNAANLTAETFESFGSVIVEPHGGPNCESTETPTDDGYNYSDDQSCGFTGSTSSAKAGNAAMLGALGDNGGPTHTLLPLAGSPLLDAIPTTVCTDVGILVDQRGVTRPQGTGCDIGAVEVEVVAPAPPPTPAPAAVVVTPRFTG